MTQCFGSDEIEICSPAQTNCIFLYNGDEGCYSNPGWGSQALIIADANNCGPPQPSRFLFSWNQVNGSGACACATCFDDCANLADNDHISTPTAVDACGAAFNVARSFFSTDCYNGNTFESDCGNGNLDCNAATSCPTCAPGVDVCYTQTDNDIWYSFCPAQSGTWTVDMNFTNCYCSQGMQYSIMQGSPSAITDYHVCDGGSNIGTHTENVPVTASPGSCVYINFDGFSGTCSGGGQNNSDICDISVSVSCGSCVGCGLLPVELTEFTGEVTPQGNRLSWNIATPEDGQFRIYRAVNGTPDFHLVGTTDVMADNQNATQFQFLDPVLAPGKYQYQLEFVDADGLGERLESYVMLYRSQNWDVFHRVLQPQNQLEIQVAGATKDPLVYTISTRDGRLVETNSIPLSGASATMRIPIEHYSTGLYIIQVQQGDKRFVNNFYKL